MATQPRLKGLPLDPCTFLFRAIDRNLRNDPVLKAVVRTWSSWEGLDGDKGPASNAQAPYVQLTPAAGGEDWWAVSTLIGRLEIDVYLFLDGWCADDLSNLWGAIERAFYPVSAADRLAFQARLRPCAHTGEVRFRRPRITNDPGSAGCIEATGSVAIDYRFDQNPTSPGY